MIQKDEKEWQDVNFQNIYVTYLIRRNSKPIYNNQIYQTIQQQQQQCLYHYAVKEEIL